MIFSCLFFYRLYSFFFLLLLLQQNSLNISFSSRLPCGQTPYMCMCSKGNRFFFLEEREDDDLNWLQRLTYRLVVLTWLFFFLNVLFLEKLYNVETRYVKGCRDLYYIFICNPLDQLMKILNTSKNKRISFYYLLFRKEFLLFTFASIFITNYNLHLKITTIARKYQRKSQLRYLMYMDQSQSLSRK